MSHQRFALEMVEATLPPSSTILDVGCGSGVMAAKLMEQGYAVWGIDFAEPMIRHAQQLCGSDQFVVGDVQDLPFPDNAFDGVVSLGVMQFMDSDEQALREIWRVLRPGGKAVIATPSGTSLLQHADRVVLSAVARLRPAYYLLKYGLRGRPAHSPESPARIVDRRYSRWTWLGLLRGLRYEPEEWICHGWGWFRSPLSLLVQRLAMGGAVLRRGLERLFGQDVLARACSAIVRSRALNWFAAEQIVRVRAIKTATHNAGAEHVGGRLFLSGESWSRGRPSPPRPSPVEAGSGVSEPSRACPA
jgi:SAM-dependent methyltransferase